LIDAYFKTERAKHHLEELRAGIAYFCKSQSYVIATEDDVEQGLYKITVRFNEPHVWLYLIAGDVFHNLRSALDHAVYRLAKESFPYPEWTQFPILETDTPGNRKRFRNYVRGLDSEEVHRVATALRKTRRYALTGTHAMGAEQNVQHR